MLRFSCSLVFYLMAILPLSAQTEKLNNAFRVGEELVFKVSYNSALGEFNAGTAKVTVEASEYKGLPTIHIVGIGETSGFFDMFYKVRDRFETQLNPATLLPYHFSRRTREGDFVFDDDIEFHREKGEAVSSRATKPIPPDVHDIVSGVYFMRTLSVEDFGDDSLYYINFYLDDSLYHSVIRFEGHDIVETEYGYLRCLKITPMVVTGEVFSRNYPMSVWVTDDENHIPVLAKSEIIIGTVRMELIEYRNLKHPLSKPLSSREVRKLKRTQ